MGRIIGALLILLQGSAGAADLKPETLQAWDQQVQAATERIHRRLSQGGPFLWADEQLDRIARLQSGEIVVSPGGLRTPVKVPSGLIHHWVGAVFIPGARLDDVLPVVRDYGRYKEFYRPTVIDSKALVSGESQDRFSMVLMNNALILKTALDSDYESSYFRVDDWRWYSISRTTRIQEIENYGGPGQRVLPENEGRGIIWKLFSVTRFAERDGGVYVEIEAMALSRDIPASLRWMVEPIVRRVSRGSLITSLRQTEDAVNGKNVQAGSCVTRPVCRARETFR